jgi:hypothetical protein
MQFFIGFFYQIVKNRNMKGKFYFLPVIFMIFSCEDKRPANHPIDLFADEIKEGKAYIMSAQECFDESDMVISSSNIKLIDQSQGRGKSVFIYKVIQESRKTTRDSIIIFLCSFCQIKINIQKRFFLYVYLKKLEGYRFIAEEKHLKYQWLKGASVF